MANQPFTELSVGKIQKEGDYDDKYSEKVHLELRKGCIELGVNHKVRRMGVDLLYTRSVTQEVIHESLSFQLGVPLSYNFAYHSSGDDEVYLVRKDSAGFIETLKALQNGLGEVVFESDGARNLLKRVLEHELGKID